MLQDSGLALWLSSCWQSALYGNDQPLCAVYAFMFPSKQAGTDLKRRSGLRRTAGVFIGGSFSGFLAAKLGYGAYYLLLGVMSLLSILLCRPIIRKYLANAIQP